MTFTEKYELLKRSVPVPPAFANDCIDCDYGDGIARCKNCYYSFDGYYFENSMYSSLGSYNKMIVDCDGINELEKYYETVDSIRCHGCTYLMDCSDCTNCHFSAFLNSCNDCFGCVALTHKKYCIFNRQYTKDEYFNKVKELQKEKPEVILRKLFELKKQIPHQASHQVSTENCPYGDFIFNSKNCYFSFNVLQFENSGYSFYSSYSKNCWDLYLSGGDPGRNLFSIRCYENANTEACYDCAYLYYSKNCTNCNYSEYLTNCTDCFGCVGLTNKKYCILNNQLTKDQYEKAVKDIKKELGWKA